MGHVSEPKFGKVPRNRILCVLWFSFSLKTAILNHQGLILRTHSEQNKESGIKLSVLNLSPPFTLFPTYITWFISSTYIELYIVTINFLFTLFIHII